MFCLLADVRIRQRTHNRYGLQDAMRAVLQASGGLAADWDINKVFAMADAAVGVPVLSQLYAQVKDKPLAPDLPALWRSLGIESDGATVRIDDAAPALAHLHRTIAERYNSALVSPFPAAGLFEPRIADVTYVRPDYLLAEGVMDVMRTIQATLSHDGKSRGG